MAEGSSVSFFHLMTNMLSYTRSCGIFVLFHQFCICWFSIKQFKRVLILFFIVLRKLLVITRFVSVSFLSANSIREGETTIQVDCVTFRLREKIRGEQLVQVCTL